MHALQSRETARPCRVRSSGAIFVSAVLVILLLVAAGLATSRPSAAQRRSRAAAPAAEYDLVIRGGRVVDGTGRRAFRADVAVRGDRVVRVGAVPAGARTRRTIDAAGLVVAPGFIDMLGQSEQNVLIDPRAMSKVMMGVTTEVTGEGGSIAPMNERLVKEDEAYYKRYNLTVDWRTLHEYFRRLALQGLGRQPRHFRRRHAGARLRRRLRQPRPDARRT
jgi:N-acyl-D-amino-acid deacylase